MSRSHVLVAEYVVSKTPSLISKLAVSNLAPHLADRPGIFRYILFLLDGMVGPGKARQPRQGRGRTSHFTEPNRHGRIAVDHTDSVPMNGASGCVGEVKK